MQRDCSSKVSTFLDLLLVYLHSEDSQLLAGQLLHLVGQNLSFLQDGKLRLGFTISTRKSGEDEDGAPGGSSQPAPPEPELFTPGCLPFLLRPPRHHGGWRNAESQLVAGEEKLQGEKYFFTTLQRWLRASFLSGTSLQRCGPSQLLENPPLKKVDPCVEGRR